MTKTTTVGDVVAASLTGDQADATVTGLFVVGQADIRVTRPNGDTAFLALRHEDGQTSLLADGYDPAVELEVDGEVQWGPYIDGVGIHWSAPWSSND